MTTDLEARVRSELSAMADSLGAIEAPADLPAPVIRLHVLPDDGGRHARVRRVVGVAACLLLLVGGVVVWQRADRSNDQAVTSEGEDLTGTTVAAEDDEPAVEGVPPMDAPTEGTWRPPQPAYGESLLRFDPSTIRLGDLPDGRHFGILDRVADVDGIAWVRFSRGDVVRGAEADRIRAEAIVATGRDPDDWEDQMALRHDWWTPEWGPESYIYPDFDAPVRLPVDLDRLTVRVLAPMEATGTAEVSWNLLLDHVDHADVGGVLPWYWTGHVDITITDGEVTRIEAWYTP